METYTTLLTQFPAAEDIKAFSAKSTEGGEDPVDLKDTIPVVINVQSTGNDADATECKLGTATGCTSL